MAIIINISIILESYTIAFIMIDFKIRSLKK